MPEFLRLIWSKCLFKVLINRATKWVSHVIASKPRIIRPHICAKKNRTLHARAMNPNPTLASYFSFFATRTKRTFVLAFVVDKAARRNAWAMEKRRGKGANSMMSDATPGEACKGLGQKWTISDQHPQSKLTKENNNDYFGNVETKIGKNCILSMPELVYRHTGFSFFSPSFFSDIKSWNKVQEHYYVRAYTIPYT